MGHVRFRRYSRGWWPAGAKDDAPEGSLRRARGVASRRHESGGLIRSRWGATMVRAVDAHSIIRFNDLRFYGVGMTFQREDVVVRTGLNGQPLDFLKMAPTAGKVDSLYVTGGGSMFKVDQAGVVSNWGIAAPGSSVTLADGGAGAMGPGTYYYAVTFRNNASGHRSNSNAGVGITQTASKRVNISNIPISADPQVTARELWRTVGNGTIYFRLTTINDNSTTTYSDNAPDLALAEEEMQDDNDAPYLSFPQFQSVAGPHATRAWWRSTAAGERGRLYFSPIARPEAVEDFIFVTNDDDPIQEALQWGSAFFAFSEARIFEVLGSGPFVARAVPEAPGTLAGRTVKATPFGILYLAKDGVRLFDGQTSRLIGFEAVGPLFHDESLEGVAAFEGTLADYYEDEYYISDGVETLALDIGSVTWRVIGRGARAFYAEDDTNVFLVSTGGNVVALEAEGVTTDAGLPIPFEIEWPSILLGTVYPGMIQYLVLDLDTAGQVLVPRLLLDEVETALPAVVTTGRTRIEWPIGRSCHTGGLRLSGSITARVTIYAVDGEYYLASPDASIAASASAETPA